jgi:hypothetical protein
MRQVSPVSTFESRCRGCPLTIVTRLGWHWSRRNALHLPRRLHHRIPSHRLGVPVRDPASEGETDGKFNIDCGQLVLSFHYRLHHSSGHSQHWMANIHHIRGAQCHLGAYHREYSSISQPSGIGPLTVTISICSSQRPKGSLSKMSTDSLRLMDWRKRFWTRSRRRRISRLLSCTGGRLVLVLD